MTILFFVSEQSAAGAPGDRRQEDCTCENAGGKFPTCRCSLIIAPCTNMSDALKLRTGPWLGAFCKDHRISGTVRMRPPPQFLKRLRHQLKNDVMSRPPERSGAAHAAAGPR